MSWFTTGSGEAQKTRKKLGAGFRPEFWLKDGTKARVVFLDKEPFNIFMHQLKIRGKIKKYTCMRKGCPLCKGNEPRFISVYRVIDMRKYTDKAGKEHKNVERYYEAGSRVQPMLEALNKKAMLFKKIVEITRKGASTDTTYALIPLGKPKVFVPPAPKLNPKKDYAPKSLEELKTVLEVIAPDEAEDEEDEGTGRNYYDESDEQTDDEAQGATDQGDDDSDADSDDDDSDDDSDEDEEDGDE